MSNTYEITPAELNLVGIKGDEFSVSLNFSISLTNYTWTAFVFESTRTVNNAYPSGIDIQGTTAESFNVNVTDAADGEMTLTLQETQTDALDPIKTYRWLLRGVAPGAITRTYVSGSFTVRTP